MDLSNLENYPVYILNANPEISDEVQIPQQITFNEPLAYNFYVPNDDHHIPTSSTENIRQIASQQSNNIKSVKKLSYEKIVRDTAANNDQNFK